jgi:hypothetical protein
MKKMLQIVRRLFARHQRPLLFAMWSLAFVLLSAGAQTNQTLRINIPAAVDVTQVHITGATQYAADAWLVTLTYNTRQNLAGRIGVDAWVDTAAVITIAITRTEIANLLGITPDQITASVAVGDRLVIPMAWVPALLRKFTIAMNPYACQRYTNGVVTAGAPMLMRPPARKK